MFDFKIIVELNQQKKLERPLQSLSRSNRVETVLNFCVFSCRTQTLPAKMEWHVTLDGFMQLRYSPTSACEPMFNY